MVRIRQLFIFATIAFSALGFSATPAHSQEDDQEIAAEEIFHRVQAFDDFRAKMPAAVNANRWQEAFLGDDKGIVHPQYIATLFRDYFKVNAANQAQTIKWVEAIAGELVARGDGDMFLLLASHYVRHNTNLGFHSPFAGARISFGKNIETLGGIIKTAMSRMTPDEQRGFKESFAVAIATTLVNNCNGEGVQTECNVNPDLAMAVAGYRLLKDFAKGTGADAQASSDDALKAMREQLGKHTFKVEDLAGLYTTNGNIDFRVVTYNYLPLAQRQSQPQFALTLLFEMGLRADRVVGDSMRHLFISNISRPVNADDMFVYGRTYELAAQQRREGLTDTLAQQVVAREWQLAMGHALSMEQIKTIYANYYAATSSGAHLYAAARTKHLNTQEQAQMPVLFTELLKQTSARPDAYYRLMHDFKGDAHYQQALRAYRLKMTLPQVAAHFDYLAGIYIHTANIGQTIDSNMRLMDLIKANAEGPASQRLTAKVFRASILKYAGAVAKDGEKSYQLAKLVATANNSGWDKLIDRAFITKLRKRLPLNPQLVDATLVSVLEVQDLRTRIEARLAAEERMRVKGWKAIIQRAAPN